MFSTKRGRVRSWKFTESGDELPVDVKLEDAKPQDFDALHLPGRRYQPDKFRIIPEAVAFAREFFGAGKPVAAICHGPWPVIETGFTHGRHMTSLPR
jgi:protease I